MREALEYVDMALNRLECEGCAQCVSLAVSYLIEARAALTGTEQEAGAVPDGWKLVPIEATLKQQIIGDEAYNDFVCRVAEVTQVYRAMVAAAPTPPAPDSGT